MKFKEFLPDVAKSNHKDATKAKVLVYVILFTVLFSFFLILLSQLNYLTTSFPLKWVFLSLVGLFVIFRFSNSISLISNLFLAISAYFQVIYSLETGGIYSVDNFFLFVIPLAAYVLSEVRSAVFWLVVVNIWSIYLFTLADSPEQIQLFRDQTMGYLPAYYLGFCVTASVSSFCLLSIFYFEK